MPAPAIPLLCLMLCADGAVEGALAGALDAAGEPSGGEPHATLPDALPPLDDKLVDEPISPLRPFGQVRVRGELDDAHDFTRTVATSAGAALTARVGLEAQLNEARLTLVVGDGGRIGSRPVQAPLVARPALPEIWQAELGFDTAIAGLPGGFSLGRMPVVVADGRFIGVEPFDPRGRTLDGARARVHTALLDANAGVFWLGPGTLDASDASGALSGLGVVEVELHPRDTLDVDVYGFLHQDGPRALTIPTAGARLQSTFGFLKAHAGADVQAPFADAAAATAAGVAGHAELGARALWQDPFEGAPSPFIDVSGELTAGDAVRGRVFRAPAPTQHDALGLLDLVAADNTWSTAAAVGIEDEDGLTLAASGRIIGVVDGRLPLLGPDAVPLPRAAGEVDGALARWELDATLELPLSEDLGLRVGYGIAAHAGALVGTTPAQRFFVSLIGHAAPARTELRSLPPLE